MASNFLTDVEPSSNVLLIVDGNVADAQVCNVTVVSQLPQRAVILLDGQECCHCCLPGVYYSLLLLSCYRAIAWIDTLARRVWNPEATYSYDLLCMKSRAEGGCGLLGEICFLLYSVPWLDANTMLICT